MDSIDNDLIALLRRDARTSISALSGRLGITRATVRARMDKLRSSGEILGYTTVLKADTRERPVRGVMVIEVEGKGADRIIRTLEGMVEVETIHTTNGRWDLVIEIGAQTLPDLDQVLRRVRLIDGVQNSETSLYLSTRCGGVRFVRG